jgi:hypothetical protein
MRARLNPTQWGEACDGAGHFAVGSFNRLSVHRDNTISGFEFRSHGHVIDDRVRSLDGAAATDEKQRNEDPNRSHVHLDSESNRCFAPEEGGSLATASEQRNVRFALLCASGFASNRDSSGTWRLFMPDTPSPELGELLNRLYLATPKQLRAVARRARRLAGEVPLLDSVWIDALAQARLLTPYQAAEINAGRGEQLLVGPYVTGRLIQRLGYADCFLAREAASEDQRKKTPQSIHLLVARGLDPAHANRAAFLLGSNIERLASISSEHLPRLEAAGADGNEYDDFGIIHGITNHDTDFTPRPVFLALQNTNALFADTKFDASIEISGVDLPALRRQTGFPFMSYGFRSAKGKAIVAYWLAAHSLPGNAFPQLYTTLSLKNTGITHPVMVDVVSGEIRPVTWKQGTTDTLELLPLKDSIMAVTDESYFDWPVLPEAPSSLIASIARGAVKLTWQVHGGDPTGSVVERRAEDAKEGRGTWKKIANLAASAVEYDDTSVRGGQRVAYRIRAVNAEGESAYSNIVRMTFSTK